MCAHTKRSIAGLAAGVLLISVLALGLGACGSQAVVEIYTDQDFGFSFDYPGDWKLVMSDAAEINTGADPVKVVLAGDPDGASVGDDSLDMLMVRVYQLRQVVDEAMLPEVLPILEDLLLQYKDQDPTFELEGALKPTTVGGVPGYQVSATFDWDKATPVQTTFYFLFIGDIEYQLVLQAASDNWESNQTVFADFVDSFMPGQKTQ